MSDLEDGKIAGDPTPFSPKGEPRAAHDKHRMFERAFADQRLTLDDLSPYRVRVAWRAVRWICVKLGALDPNLLLCMMPEHAREAEQGLDPLYRPCGSDQFQPPSPDRATRRLMEIVRQCEDHGQEVPYQRLHSQRNSIETATKRGFTLLPTPQTAEYWVKAFAVASEHLFLSRGSEEDKDQGRYGMLGLTDHTTAALACPLLSELLMWELFLVDECVGMMATQGEHLIDASLRQHYGLLPDETRPLLGHARRVIRERTDLDVSEQRAVMVLQINDVLSRCHQTLDPRAELAALKLKSQIIGITRAEPEDIHKMFRKVVQNNEPRKRQIEYTPSSDNEATQTLSTEELPT